MGIEELKTPEQAEKLGMHHITENSKAGYELLEEYLVYAINAIVLGITGIGKSKSVIIPYLKNVIRARESALVMDPKGEIRKYVKDFIDPEVYDVVDLDLIDPASSPNGFNPLAEIYRYYFSNDIKDRDYALQMMDDLFNSLYKQSQDDPFWENSSINVAEAILMALLRYADKEEINLYSFAKMMTMLDQKHSKERSKTEADLLYDILPEESLEKILLAGYVGAASETRRSTFSVATHELSVFFKSEGIRNFLCRDDFDLTKVDLNKPTLIFISLPPESDRADTLASLLIAQIVRFLFHNATKLGGKLPKPWTLVLDEIGICAKAIPGLDRYMSIGRSHGVKTLLSVQSEEQIYAAYGVFERHRATSILDTCNLTIGFSSNNYFTMNKLARRTGDMIMSVGNAAATGYNISPQALQDLPVGKAICEWEDKKVLVKFPLCPTPEDFDKPLDRKPVDVDIKCFDLHDYIDKAEKVKAERLQAEREELMEKLHKKKAEGNDLEQCISDIRKKDAPPYADDNSFKELSEMFINIYDDDDDDDDIFDYSNECVDDDEDFPAFLRKTRKKFGHRFDDDNRASEDAINSLSTRQLIDNRESSVPYHIQIRSIADDNTESLAKTLSQIDNNIGEHAWSVLLLHLPYIINCSTKSILEAIRKAIEKAGGESIIVSDDEYYAASDFIEGSDADHGILETVAKEAIRNNFMLRNRFKYHLKIKSCEKIAATARALAKILPEFDEYTARKILREKLPFSIHTEKSSSGTKAAEAILKLGGKAEATSG